MAPDSCSTIVQPPTFKTEYHDTLPFLCQQPKLWAAMKLDGSILDYLANSLASARRLRGHPVYQDTLIYWGDLVREARRLRQDPACEQSEAIGAAIAELESELAERRS